VVKLGTPRVQSSGAVTRTGGITSAVGHRRIRRAREWLEARAAAEEVLIVGATLDAANELARGVAKEKAAAFGWHRLTLSQLANAIATPALATRQLTPLSPIGTEAIVTRIVYRLNEQGRLGRYRALATTPGFPRAAASVIRELRLARLLPDSLAGTVPDLLPLVATYETELKEASLTDWPGVLALATEAASVAGASQHRLLGLPMLLLDVPITNQAELAFIGALAAPLRELLVTVPAADQSTLSRVRHQLRIHIENLDEKPSGDEGDISASYPSALRNLQCRLFSERSVTIEAKPDDTVEIFSAPGEGRECVEIARRVLCLARRGIPFDRMAVLLRSPQGYRAHLEEAFHRAGIPLHHARGAVRPDPAGRAFCALLKCAAEGLSAQRFAEYLSLAQLPDAAPGGGPPQAAPSDDRWVAPDCETGPWLSTDDAGDGPRSPPPAPHANDEVAVREGQLRAPRRWERLLVEAAVIGGRDRWRRRIDGLANDIGLRLSELAVEDEAQAAALSRTLDDLTAFAGYAIPLIDALDGLPTSANWDEWLDQLGALATRALKEPDRVLAVLAELAPMGPVGPVALHEVLLTLERLLLEVAVPPPSQRYGKVLVAPIEAARGLSFEGVFVPGLAEKMFPRKIVEEPILLDAVREQIGAGLATNQVRLERERLAMALAAGAAEHRICFSYPRLDLDEARPRVPSFYTLEAVRAAEGLLPDFAELARRAETATTARLGWPAPPDPADAIDDAEHDLAVLDRLESRREDSPGAARYLVTVNPYLARALRTRYQRWGRSWTASDGLLSASETVRAIMAKHALDLRSYSPTALQNYARCPYRFFLQAIHGLAPREIPEAIEELDPLQRGSLIHDVQFALFGSLRQNGLLPVRPNNLYHAHQELDAIIGEVAARYRDDLAPAIDRVWEDGVAAIRADLREWLRRASEDDSGYVPWYFELSFGLEQRPERRQADPDSVPGAVELDCGIRLRGSIDLVERHPAGMARVTDHKTGKADSRPAQRIDGGRSLQPLLYALAAEKLFAGQAKISSGRLYFCTSGGGFAEQVVLLDERARAVAAEVAEAIGDAIAHPFLPAAPDKRQCDRCDFRVVCGPYEERRVARKPRRNLQSLLALRAVP
jgi:ATP-dependent helicase/nuclease subunit B